MPSFRVVVYDESTYSYIVDADNADEAQAKVEGNIGTPAFPMTRAHLVDGSGGIQSVDEIEPALAKKEQARMAGLFPDLTGAKREETFKRLVDTVAPSDPFLILEHDKRGLLWEAIWNTYLADEWEDRIVATVSLAGVPSS